MLTDRSLARIDEAIAEIHARHDNYAKRNRVREAHEASYSAERAERRVRLNAEHDRTESVRIRERDRLKLEYDRARAQKDPPLPPPDLPPPPPSPPPPSFPSLSAAEFAAFVHASARKARGEPPEPEKGEDGDRDKPKKEPPDPAHGEDDDQDDAPGGLILRAVKRRLGK